MLMSVLAGRKNANLNLRLIIPLLATLALLASCSRQKAAEPVAPKTFATPAAAGAALFDAAKAGDQNALVAIFGPDGKDLVFSGDAVKDKNVRQRFVEAYSQMNRWSKSKSGDEILYIGADNF